MGTIFISIFFLRRELKLREINFPKASTDNKTKIKTKAVPLMATLDCIWILEEIKYTTEITLYFFSKKAVAIEA